MESVATNRWLALTARRERSVQFSDVNLGALIGFGCQFYPDSEDPFRDRDAAMFQRLFVAKFLKCCASTTATCSNQSDHIMYLAKEHFDHVEQVVTAADFKIEFAQHCLRDTEWRRIRELYHSLRRLQKLDDRRDEATHLKVRQWELLMNASPLDDGEVSSLPGEVACDQQCVDDDSTRQKYIAKIMKVLAFVKHVVKRLIPAHVFELGPVPSDAEIKYLLYAEGYSHYELRRCDVFNIFSTRHSHRVDALANITKMFGNANDNSDESVAVCRSLGYRAHATLATLCNSYTRFRQVFRENFHLMMRIIEICETNTSDDGRMRTLCDLVHLVKVARDFPAKDSSERDWVTNRQIRNAFQAFQTAFGGPQALLHEACNNLVSGVLMGTKKESLPGVLKGVFKDFANKEPRSNPEAEDREYDENQQKEKIGTSLVFDVLKDKGLRLTPDTFIVAGDTDFKVKSALTNTIFNIFSEWSSCARAKPRSLGDEPCLPLPSGRLQQDAQTVHSLLHGDTTIIDLGFRSDGRYFTNRAGNAIEFVQGDHGLSFSEAVMQFMTFRSVPLVRFQGSTVIENKRSTVVILCRTDSNRIRFETTINGHPVSQDNPVTVVIATDRTDPKSPIPFHRFAQDVRGTRWRKEMQGHLNRSIVADKAVQVATVLEAEYNLEMSVGVDVFNNVVYQSSKQLLENFDRIRSRIEAKWKTLLDQSEHYQLAECLLELLVGDTRILAVSEKELPHAATLLHQLQYVVKDIPVDDLSFVAKRSLIRGWLEQPSISFIHFQLVGHLQFTNVETICFDLSPQSSLRLLIVASPSTQAFAQMKFVAQTPSASKEFHPTRIVGFELEKYPFLLEVPESLHSEATRTFQSHSYQSFVNAVVLSSATNKLTIICHRGERSVRPSDYALKAEYREAFSSSIDVFRELQLLLQKPGRFVYSVDYPSIKLARFVFNETVVDACFIDVPVPMSSNCKLKSALGLETAFPELKSDDSSLLSEWQTVQSSMVFQNISMDFADFIRVVPECEWLDHRGRVQLYLLHIWGVPLNTSATILHSIRNVTSLPLPSTLLVTTNSVNQLQHQPIEEKSSYSEMVVGGTITMDDVLHASISTHVDIPWNSCARLWSIAPPFSSEMLTEVLSVYPYPLRVLMALGPSLFHTLGSVELFAGNTPFSWAVKVASRLHVFTELLQQNLLTKEHCKPLSVVKWLFLRRGWNDRKDARDRDGQTLTPITFGAYDFEVLDEQDIIMDVMEDPSTSTDSGMSSQTRHAIALILVSIQGSPNLFTKQPRILDYFLRTPQQGGITNDAAAQLVDALQSPEQTLFIGAPFLSILKDSTLHAMCALRKQSLINNLWRWFNGEVDSVSIAQVSTVFRNFSSNAWGYAVSTVSPSQTRHIIDLVRGSEHSQTPESLTIFSLSSIIQSAMSIADIVPGAIDAATIVVLCSPQDEFVSSEHNGISHLIKLIQEPQRFNALQCAQTLVASGYAQFRVEQEGEQLLLTRSLMQLSFLGENSIDSDFPAAVLFFDRCFSKAGRQHLLRAVTDLLHQSVSSDHDTTQPFTRSSLENAAAALWLHMPLAPCPLGATSSAALLKIKRMLVPRVSGVAFRVNLPHWTASQIDCACIRLRTIASAFRYFVETEYQIVSDVALALIGWDHYLPTALLQQLHDSGIVDNVPTHQATNLIVQGGGFVPYQIAFSLRPLPRDIFDHYFKADSYSIIDGDVVFDVSHGLTAEILQRNLSFLATKFPGVGAEGEDFGPETVLAKLCVIMWLKALGLVVDCHNDDWGPSIVNLIQRGDHRERMEVAMKELQEQFLLHKNDLAKDEELFIHRTTFPSFIDTHVLRHSPLLRFFDHTTMESILYTLDALTAVLRVIPTSVNSSQPKFTRGEIFPNFLADASLAKVVFEEPLSKRERKLYQCFVLVAVEIGYRLASAWGSLTPSSSHSVIHSVMSAPYSFLSNGLVDKGRTLLLLIADVALEELTDMSERATLCSALVMAIGFQDRLAIKELLCPLLALMGGVRDNDALNYDGVIAPARSSENSVQRAYLTRKAAKEVIWWRDSFHYIPEDAGAWLVREEESVDWGTRFGKIDANPRFINVEEMKANTYIVNDVCLSSTAVPEAINPTEQPTPPDSEPPKRFSLFREAPLPEVALPLPTSHTNTTAYASDRPPSSTKNVIASITVIDVCSILDLRIPVESLITGGQICVRPGLACALLAKGDELCIKPLTDIRSYNDFSIVCYFEDFGSAWEYCLSRTHPASLVGRGFMLTTTERSGWRVIIGLYNGLSSINLRPWHILAFHELTGMRSRGPSEDPTQVGGPILLAEWMCHRACQYVGHTGVNTIQEVVCFLTTYDDHENKLESVYHFLLDVLKAAVKAIETQGEKERQDDQQTVRLAIHQSLAAQDIDVSKLKEESKVLEKISISRLVTALRRSFFFLATRRLEAFVATGAQCEGHLRQFFEHEVTQRNLSERFPAVIARQSDSLELVNKGIAFSIATEMQPTQSSPVSSVDSNIRIGNGLQSGEQRDVFFALSRSYPKADLVYEPIDRKEKYHYVRGLPVGHVLDKRLFNLDNRGDVNEALVMQWIKQVLESPLSVVCKDWFLLHLHTEKVSMPAFKHEHIAQLLAIRCEVGSVRDIVSAAFDELPQFCKRCNRVYGVITMFNPSIEDWIAMGYDVEVQKFALLPTDEEAFRAIVDGFNVLTTHVVVYGFDKAPMSDRLLKWLCEYTFRFPWRFIVLVNCDTTSNLPETRDRVTNLLPSHNRNSNIITQLISPESQRCESFVQYLPTQTSGSAFYTERQCDWSEAVEKLLAQSEGLVLIHLITPPGGGKTTLMQDLQKKKVADKFVRVDCSDARLAEEALLTLLNEALVGIDFNSKVKVVLVADEYHMLKQRKKEEFMQWAKEGVQKVRIIMIANRADPQDKKLLAEFRSAHPTCKETIACTEGRISAHKVRTVIRKTYNDLSAEQVNLQAREFYCFLATLRGMLGDDSISLRLEEHFKRAGSGQAIDNYAFTSKIQDKLVVFGQNSIARIMKSYESLNSMVSREVQGMSTDDRHARIVDLYKESLSGSPTKLLVFTSMLVPLLLYKDPTSNTNLVQECDRSLCYRDIVELTGNLRHASCAVRLALWVRYVTSFVQISLKDSEHETVFKTLRRLNLIDFPDFPIIREENMLVEYSLEKQKATFVGHHDLTDLDWIFHKLSCRVAVDWAAIARTWRHNPVTDSEKLCTVIDQAGAATVFMSMSPSNVLQLLKRNPTGAFRDTVVKSYPISRIKDEMRIDVSPYFFAAYAYLVMLDPSKTDLMVSEFNSLVGRPRGEESEIAKSFLFWISNHGSMVPSVPQLGIERTTAVIRMIATVSNTIQLSMEEHSTLWRGKYLAPAAELFAADGSTVIPIDRAYQIAKGLHAYDKVHDKWPPAMKLLNRIATSNREMLSESEATYLLDLGVTSEANVPPRVVGALLQAEPPGWLSLSHQSLLLSCNVVVGQNDINNDERYAFNAHRNVQQGRATGCEVKLRCEFR